MKRHYLTSLVQFFCRVKCLHAIFLNHFFRTESVVGVHFHSEAFSYTGNVTTNVSVCMDTQFLAHQFCTGSTVIEVTNGVYHHAQSQFGNSIGVLSRSIHHANIVSGSGSQVYIIVSGTSTNYNLQFFSSIQHLCINNITTDNDSISIFHCIQQLCFIGIFLQQSKLISGCFDFFTDTVYSNFGKRFFSSYKYFHNLSVSFKKDSPQTSPAYTLYSIRFQCKSVQSVVTLFILLMKFFKFLHAVDQSLYTFFRQSIVARCTETTH